MRWYRKAAEGGCEFGQNNLASSYHRGDGVEKDERKAAKWFLRSAEQGFAPAQLAMAAAYLAGKGVEYDPEEGMRWLRLAANQGMDEARRHLDELEASYARDSGQ